MSTHVYKRWVVKWRERSILDGYVENPIFEAEFVKTFRTKRETVAWIKEHFGYIAKRPDLRAEPHGRLMPGAVKATITVELP